jgi:hypothetical protein
LRIDKSAIQRKIRTDLQVILDGFLSEDLYRISFIEGIDVWNFGYKYHSIAEFKDEVIYCGEVCIKVKKKYSECVKEKEFRYTFQSRMKSRYDIELNLTKVE